MIVKKVSIGFYVLALAASLTCFAAVSQKEQSAAEIATELSSPTYALGSLPNNFNEYGGNLPINLT